MPNVRSIWKLTYDPSGTPVVILNFGDKLASEILWPSARGGEEAPLVDSVAPFLRDSGNRAVRVSYDRIEPASDYPAVAKAVMTRLVSHGSMAKKPLKIEVEGVAECYWLATQCLVPTMEPGIRVMGVPEMVTRYSLVFASIAEVDTEEDPLVIADPTPEDPGAFLSPTLDPTDTGSFPSPSASPSDPGDFNPSNDAVPDMLIGGTLSPDATGAMAYDGLDGGGNKTWARASDSATLTWDFAENRYIILRPTPPAGFVTWQSGVTSLVASPLPSDATGWEPGVVVGPSSTPTGTPTVAPI